MSSSNTAESQPYSSVTATKDVSSMLPATVEVFKLRFEIPQIQRSIDEVLLSVERTTARLEGQTIFPEDQALLDSLAIVLQVFSNEIKEKSATYLALTGKEFEVVGPLAQTKGMAVRPFIEPIPSSADHLNGNGTGLPETEASNSEDFEITQAAAPEINSDVETSSRGKGERIDYEGLLKFVDAELYSRFVAQDYSAVPYDSIFMRFFEEPPTTIFNSRLNILLPRLHEAARKHGLQLLRTKGKPKNPSTLRYATPEENTDLDPAQNAEKEKQLLQDGIHRFLYEKYHSSEQFYYTFSYLVTNILGRPFQQEDYSLWRKISLSLVAKASSVGCKLESVITLNGDNTLTENIQLKYITLVNDLLNDGDDTEENGDGDDNKHDGSQSFQIDPEKDPLGAQMLLLMSEAVDQVAELYRFYQEKRVSKLRIERVNYMLSRTPGSTKISRAIKDLGLGTEESMTLWFSPREVAIIVTVGKAGLAFGNKFAEVFEKFTATLPPEDLDNYSLPPLIPTQTYGKKRKFSKKK